MYKPAKVVLFSLLIFPGAGHFLLRKWKWGLFFVAVTLVPISYVVKYAYTRASDIMDGILSGQISPEPEAVRALIYARPSGEDAFLLAMAHALLLACWLGAVGHAWMTAKSCQAPAEQPDQTPHTN